MKKTRLLCLVQLPPPIHGVTMMNRYLCESSHLQSHFSIKVLPLSFSNSLLDIEKFSLKKVMRFFFFQIRLIKTIVSFRPDLIYFTFSPRGFAFYRDLIFLGWMRLLRSKVLLHLHGQGLRQASQKNWLRLLCKLCFAEHFFITQSKLLYEDIRPLVREEKVFYLVNGIPLELNDSEFAKLQVARAGRDSPVQILFLSNIIATKGPMLLLEALAALKKKGCLFRAVFAGFAKDEEYLKTFLAAMEAYGLKDEATYLGSVQGQSKKDLLAESDIFVHPTFFDAFPLVLLEAMQYGLPVISTYEGGIADIVAHEKTGYLVRTGDHASLSAYLEKLLVHGSARAMLGTAARQEFVKRFSLAQYESDLAKIMATCTAPHPGLSEENC